MKKEIKNFKKISKNFNCTKRQRKLNPNKAGLFEGIFFSGGGGGGGGGREVNLTPLLPFIF